MKNLAITIIILLCNLSSGWSQKSLEFVQVFQAEGQTAEQIYKKIDKWVLKAYNNPVMVSLFSDPYNYEIQLRPEVTFKFSKLSGSASVNGPISYFVKINARDGRYRIEINECYHNVKNGLGILTNSEEYSGGKYKSARKWANEVWKELKETMQAEATLTMSMIEAAVKEAPYHQEEDW